MEYYVLDRIEGQTAILVSDGGDVREFPAASLPCGAAEGDVLICGEGGLSVDREETGRRRVRMEDRLLRLLNKKGRKEQ